MRLWILIPLAIVLAILIPFVAYVYHYTKMSAYCIAFKREFGIKIKKEEKE